MRLKFGVALVVTVVLFSAGLDLVAWGDSGFPKEELISLIANAADNLDSGNTEDALDQLLEAKGILASQIAALSPGEREIVLGNLAFSILGADKVAEYNPLWDYYRFTVYLQISNLGSEVVAAGWDTIGGITVSGFAISPEGKQLEDNSHLEFDYLLPGVDKDIPIEFVIGLLHREEFIPGKYTIIIRLGLPTGEARFLKDQFTILKEY